ncbi:MAG: hypothetical protein CO073_00155 [Candidatus Komeilibacteria bacterium CG_4_9_14_0_8_um_filter_36_9]|uniref:Heat-inducible transcription repressor HrcA C-terminal domain-containing protein n=1 Tax=Candidatus Komeilibacteria bacterium CG_4_9_14_0_8_um_filter_36_9 TaxID=1974473 RepID=A0A2M8DSH2_9BACT|nr:MAG: hypothetical protein CO073_00155 [Candidatus Komeilibacteria bacterium CG_4_9_14_0_8_um_filter_36_9]
MELNKRKNLLLGEIILEYIRTAEPVGSKYLATEGKFDLSPATIRNEMAELEKDGLIYQPHTSAGRVPTPAGYLYYLENIVKDKQITGADKKKLRPMIIKVSGEDIEQSMKDLAKEVAELVDSAVVLALSPYNVFYTGITNIFKQPEFFEKQMIINMSQVIDHLDEVMAHLFNTVDQTEVLIGSDNPFGQDTGAILTKCHKGDQKVVFGIVGPLRMDYQRNLSIINYLTAKLNG